MRRSSRSAARLDYKEILKGNRVLKMDDGVSIHPEGDLTGFDEEDAVVLADMVLNEEAENQALEAKVAALRAQEDNVRKQKILDHMEKLQYFKERNALLKKVVAGELPASAIKSRPRKDDSNVTPRGSPATIQGGSGVTPGTTSNIPVAVSSNVSGIGPQGPPTKQGEYVNLLNSILQLKHGNLAPFTDLMANQANFASNADVLPTSSNLDKSNSTSFPASQARKNLKFDSSTTVGENNSATTPIVPLLVDSNSINCATSANAKSIVVTKSDKQEHCVKGQDEGTDSEGEEDPKKGKKRKSGILTKPEESNIVKTVKFPHELLDDRHVKVTDKVFNKLTFPLFCAGELELIKRQRGTC